MQLDETWLKEALIGGETAATFYAPSLTTSKSLTPTKSYYRSRLTIAEQHHNPIVLAARGLLSLAPRLRETHRYQDVNHLAQDLHHELNAFTNKLEAIPIETKQIFLSRFILCHYLDNILLQTPWAEAWQTHNLIHHYLTPTDAKKLPALSDILEQLMRKPKKYISLLELCYLCLSLSPLAETEFNTRTRLFRVMLYHRGQQQVVQTTLTPIQAYPAKRLLLATLSILFGLNVGYTYFCHISQQPARQSIASVEHMLQDHHVDI